MEIKKLNCPECGASFESNEKVSFCSHCGAKLFFDDGNKNININYKNEDVSKIKEVEANKEIEIKKMEMEDKHKMSRYRYYLYAIRSWNGSIYVDNDI